MRPNNSASSNNQDLITSKRFNVVDRNVRVMLCGLVFFLSDRRISRDFAPSCNVRSGGGIWLFSAIHMLVATAVAHQPCCIALPSAAINSGAYVIAWHDLAGLRGKSKDPGGRRDLAEAQTDQDWNEALEQARARISFPSESLLDTMNKTVAQLFDRREHQKVIAVSNVPQLRITRLKFSSSRTTPLLDGRFRLFVRG